MNFSRIVFFSPSLWNSHTFWLLFVKDRLMTVNIVMLGAFLYTFWLHSKAFQKAHSTNFRNGSFLSPLEILTNHPMVIEFSFPLVQTWKWVGKKGGHHWRGANCFSGYSKIQPHSQISMRSDLHISFVCESPHGALWLASLARACGRFRNWVSCTLWDILTTAQKPMFEIDLHFDLPRCCWMQWRQQMCL